MGGAGALLARPGRVLSRQQLEDKLYAWGEEISSNAVEVYIHGVRRKLGAGLIENVRGLGYLVPAAPAGGAEVGGDAPESIAGQAYSAPAGGQNDLKMDKPAPCCACA
jgi:DNA-binding winged helix-turn-helix (wHTH) protein